MELPYDTTILLLDLHALEIRVERATHTLKFSVALFKIKQTWKQLLYPSADECIKSLAHMNNGIFRSQNSFQSLSYDWPFITPWTAIPQVSLSIANSLSLPKLMSNESAMPFNHLILCHLFHFLLLIFPSIRDFSNESVLPMRWPKYWNFRVSISPSKEYLRLISFKMDWLYLLAVKGLSRVFPNTTVQKHEFFRAQLSL